MFQAFSYFHTELSTCYPPLIHYSATSYPHPKHTYPQVTHRLSTIFSTGVENYMCNYATVVSNRRTNAHTAMPCR